MADFGGARKWAQKIIEENVPCGGKVIDATMGNGHDTKWLCELVGEEGKVYAFDVQEEAVKNTKARLEEAGLSERAVLYLKGHETMGLTVRSMVDAVVFNLGWLPGAEKTIRTNCNTTLSAVSQALSLIKKGGVVTICVYPGHQEGDRELEELTAFSASLDDKVYDAVIFGYANIKKKPPVLIGITKR